MKMTVARKLGFGFASLLVLFVLMSVVVYTFNVGIIRDSTEISQDDVPGVTLSLSMLNEISKMNGNITHYLVGEKEEREEFKANYQEFRQHFEALKKLKTGPEEIKLMEKIERLTAEYVSTAEQEIFDKYDPDVERTAIAQAEFIEREYGAKLELLLEEAKESELQDAYRATSTEEIVTNDLLGLHYYLELVDEAGDLASDLSKYVHGEPGEKEAFVSDSKEFEDFLNKLHPLKLRPIEVAKLANIEILYKNVQDGAGQVFSLYDPRAKAEAIATADRIEQEIFTELEKILVGLAAEQQRNAATAVEGLITTLNKTSLAMGLVTLIAIAIGGLAAMAITRMISNPLTAMARTAAQIAAGDLEQTIQLSARDEMGVLAQAFNQMIQHLRQRIEAEQEASEKAAQLAQAERKSKEQLQQTVDDYLTFVEQVAGGNLTARLRLNGHGQEDALTVLGHNLNNMVANLEEMAGQIRQSTANISAAATDILAATAQQAANANHQSAAISQVSTTIAEVKTIVEQAFDRAQGVAQQAQHTRDISQTGRQAVTDTVTSMGQIKDKVEGIAENILALSEQTQQIGEITATVNEIAAQSNLLALNASVEAARAGEHGKGFAVVAVEVRNLAEQSRHATAQVKEILTEIQQATNTAVIATEQGIKDVDVGVQQTRQAGGTIQQLAGSITDSANAAQQIVASAREQTTGIEQIAQAIENISQTTNQNLASSHQAKQAAQGLSAISRQLEGLVARYELKSINN